MVAIESGYKPSRDGELELPVNSRTDLSFRDRTSIIENIMMRLNITLITVNCAPEEEEYTYWGDPS